MKSNAQAEAVFIHSVSFSTERRGAQPSARAGDQVHRISEEQEMGDFLIDCGVPSGPQIQKYKET